MNVISLVLTKKALRARLRKDAPAGIRTEDVIAKSLERISLYEYLDTVKIHVYELLPEKTAERIIGV